MLPFLILSLLTTVAADMSGFIVGGDFASIEDWPFIATVMAFTEQECNGLCGGSLISSQTVLTAAHCLDDVTNAKKNNVYTFTIFMGNKKLTDAILKRDAYDYQTHEGYDPLGVAFDLGIVFLEEPVVFQPTVKKVLMINSDMGKDLEATGGLAVAGWGQYSPDSKKSSEILRSLNQTLINWDRCRELLDEETMDPGVICAGDVNSNNYANSGDSGGPLARIKDQFLAGVVSYKPLTISGITVYTSVAYFYSWIENTQRTMFHKYCPDADFKDETHLFF